MPTMLMHEVSYRDYKNRQINKIVLLEEGRRDPDKQNGLKWARTMFGKMTGDAHFIFVMPERKNKTLGKIVSSSVVVILLALALNGPSFAANLPPVKGGKLPVIILPIPKDLHEKSYLGLSGEGFFKISQIKAKGVLIKIFNLYCPVCQSTAAAMNELFHQIEENPDLKDKIKLIGIGAGNSLLEVEVFKQTNHISFPVFPDEDFTIHKALGEVRTPFFIATRMNRDGSHEIVHTHLGALTEVRAFLDLMVEAYGIHQDDLQKKKKLATSTANESSSNDELELRVR